MGDEHISRLAAMSYRWGFLQNGQWQEKGSIVITPKGALLDDEQLSNPRYHSTSRSLVFGGEHGSFARTGRLTFDPTQLYFHGSVEQNDGTMQHVIGFADFDVTYSSIIKPASDPSAPAKVGPSLHISIQETAFNAPADSSAISFTLKTNGTTSNITNRVTSHNLDTANHQFEISMGPGGPFPPTTNLFDVTMAADMSHFEGSYQSSSREDDRYTWSGRAEQNALSQLADRIEAASTSLEQATIPQIRMTVTSNGESETALAEEPVDSSDSLATLSGLDAQDLAFLAKMDAKGIKIATLDNIRAISITKDKKGKSVVVDQAQKATASMMNSATLKSLEEPWKSDFLMKVEPLDAPAEVIRNSNLGFFSKNAELQMGSLLKYKQDSFTGVNLEAIQTISQPKLDEKWKVSSMQPERLNGYMKASIEMYGHAYTNFANEFSAYNGSDKEQWGRAYFHWLTDPSQLSSWQKQLSILDSDQITLWIYEWHAKLSILAPNQPYATQMEAYALASFISAKAQTAAWSAGAIPFLTEAIAHGGQASASMQSASGEHIDSLKAPYIKQKLQELETSVGAATVSNAVSAAALTWQEANSGGPYYADLYSNPDALKEIAEHIDPASLRAFNDWAASAITDSATQSSAGEILAYCVYAAVTGFLLAGLAPKADDSQGTSFVAESGVDVSPEIAWVLKGLKIGQVVINGGAGFFNFFFARRIASLWTQYIGEAGEASPEFSRALAALTNAVENGEEIAGWGLSFGADLSTILKFAGPIFALLGTGIAIYNLVKDIVHDRIGDGILDAISVVVGVVGVSIGLAVLGSVMTAATAGPIGLAIAIIGAVVLAFKFLWDWLFPPPTPIQEFVSGPLTDLGVVVSP